MAFIKREAVMFQGRWQTVAGEDVVPPPPPVTAQPPVYVGSGPRNATAGGATISWYSGTIANDIGLLVVESANETITLSTANGFVEITGSPQGTGTAAGTTSVRIAVYWCRAASSTPAAPVVADAGDHIMGKIHVFRGCPTTGNPWSGTPVGGTAASSASVSVTGYTTADDATLVVQLCAYATDTTTPQSSAWANSLLKKASNGAAGVDKLDDDAHSAGNGGGVFLTAGILDTAGPTGAMTATLAAASVQAKLTVALKGTAGTGPPPTGSFRTYVGVTGIPKATWGSAGTPMPDTTFSDSNGANYVGTGGYIAAARAAGVNISIKVTGGGASSVQVNNPTDTRFSATKWKNNLLAWYNQVVAVTGGLVELQNAVRDGIIRFILTVDDFISGSSDPDSGFLNPVTYEEHEDICSYSKGLMPWMPLVARGVNTYLKTTATKNGVVRQYLYLDGGWAQFRPSADGGSSFSTVGARAAAYFADNVAAGKACGLSIIGGGNMFDRGTGGDPAWGCIVANNPARCAMSPEELRQTGQACLANKDVVGCNFWAYSSGGSHAYHDRTEIQSALATVAGYGAGRTDPPVNIRGDLVILP